MPTRKNVFSFCQLPTAHMHLPVSTMTHQHVSNSNHSLLLHAPLQGDCRAGGSVPAQELKNRSGGRQRGEHNASLLHPSGTAAAQGQTGALACDTSFAHIASTTHTCELFTEFQRDFHKASVEKELPSVSRHINL